VLAVVLLPGMDGSGALFEDFASELKATSLVISYPTDQPLGYGELEEFVLAALPKTEPFILLAESFSGPIAVALAARQLPQLRGVVLVCSFAKAPLAFPTFLQKYLARLPFWRVPVALAARVLLGRYRSKAIEMKLEQAIRAVSPEVWRGRLRAALSVDSTTDLCRIQVPVLYLRASEDKVVFSSASEVICRHVSTAKVMEIEGPHFLLQAKPIESAAAIRAFADEHCIAL
jgi:pimeloyl-[acyl-carrier protein] methyl ester esterase